MIKPIDFKNDPVFSSQSFASKIRKDVLDIFGVEKKDRRWVGRFVDLALADTEVPIGTLESIDKNDIQKLSNIFSDPKGVSYDSCHLYATALPNGYSRLTTRNAFILSKDFPKTDKKILYEFYTLNNLNEEIVEAFGAQAFFLDRKDWIRIMDRVVPSIKRQINDPWNDFDFFLNVKNVNEKLAHVAERRAPVIER